jgi:plastocyanin
MPNRISRRSVVAGAVLVPFAGVGLRSVLANQESSKADAEKDPAASASPSPMASPGASPAASPMASPAAGGDSVTIVAEDIKFDKTEMRIPANTDVEVTLENKGMLEHDWVVDELDVVIGPLSGGETASGTVNAEAGEYEYYCSIPGHKEAGMVGKLIVE